MASSHELQPTPGLIKSHLAHYGRGLSSSFRLGMPSKNLLDLILERLIPVSNYIMFTAVCKHWRSVALHNRKRRLKSCHRQLPMLMVPSKDNNDEMRGLYSVTQGKTCTFELHVPYNTRCCGSSHRLLAYADDKSVITFLNPFTGRAISLPPVTKVPRLFIRPERYIRKVVCLLTLICFRMIMKLWYSMIILK